jgi:hypothetical protein
LHAGIAACRVGDCALAYDVVGDDQAAGARQPQRPGEIIRIARLVGVDEEQIERAEPFGGDLRQRIERAADADFDQARETRAGHVRARDLRAPGIGLERDQMPAGR